MATPQPDNKNLLWTMIAGAVVLLLVIYIFAGVDRSPAPPAAPPAVSAPTVPEAPPPP